MEWSPGVNMAGRSLRRRSGDFEESDAFMAGEAGAIGSGLISMMVDQLHSPPFRVLQGHTAHNGCNERWTHPAENTARHRNRVSTLSLSHRSAGTALSGNGSASA